MSLKRKTMSTTSSSLKYLSLAASYAGIKARLRATNPATCGGVVALLATPPSAGFRTPPAPNLLSVPNDESTSNRKARTAKILI